MPRVEVLVRAPGAPRHEPIRILGEDLVDEEKGRAMGNPPEDLG
jgi:hypothetical protein